MKARLLPIRILFYLALFLAVSPLGIQAQDAKPSSANPSSPALVKQQSGHDLVGRQYDNKYGHSGEQARKDFFGPLALTKKSELSSNGGNEVGEKIKESVYKIAETGGDVGNKVGRDDKFQAGLGETGKQFAKKYGSKLIKPSLTARLYNGLGLQSASGVELKQQIANLKRSVKIGNFANKAGGVMPYIDTLSEVAGHAFGGQYTDSAIALASGAARAALVNEAGAAGAVAGTAGGPVLAVVGAIGSAWVAGAVWDSGVALGKGLPGKGITGKVGNMLDTFFNLSAPPSSLPSNYRGESILENDTLVLDPSRPRYTANLPPSFVGTSPDLTFLPQNPDISSFADDQGAITPEIKEAVSGVDPKSSFDNALPLDDAVDIGNALKGVDTLVSNSGGKEAGSEAGETIMAKLQGEAKIELAQEVRGSLQAGAKNEISAEIKAKKKAARSTGRRVPNSRPSSSGRSGRGFITQPTKHVCTPRCKH